MPLGLSGWQESIGEDRLGTVRAQFFFCVCATLVDGTGTMMHLARGATELNPIWANLIDQTGAATAMGVRMLAGLALLGILFLIRRHPLARAGIVIVVAAFIPLTIYHVFLFVYLPLVL